LNLAWRICNAKKVLVSEMVSALRSHISLTHPSHTGSLQHVSIEWHHNANRGETIDHLQSETDHQNHAESRAILWNTADTRVFGV
jgi:hypothetical protein